MTAPFAVVNGSGCDEKARVIVNQDEGSVVVDVLAVLPSMPEYYVRDHRLVVLAHNPVKDRHSIHDAHVAQLRTDLCRYIRFLVLSDVKGKPDAKPCHPPTWLTESVIKRREWPGMRWLSGVITTPIIDERGDVQQAQGYDPGTMFYYAPAMKFPKVPELLTQEQAARAYAFLCQPFADFPFVSENDRAAAVALVLTMLGRPAIKGPCPMFLVQATTKGTGKTLLARIATAIAEGSPSPLTEYKSNEEELAKTMESIAYAGDLSIIFDNITHRIGCGALDMVLTGTEAKFRELGSHNRRIVDWNAVVIATANNPTTKADTARRILPIRLETSLENPQDRSDFRFPDVIAWVKENRALLVVAGLTILRAHAAACWPVGVPQWGSYEAWRRTVGAAVHWASGHDPLATRENLDGDDEGANALDRLLKWFEGMGMTQGKGEQYSAAALLGKASHDEELMDVLECLHGKQTKLDSRALGYALRANAKRIRANRYLVAERNDENVSMWTIAKAAKPATSGDA